MQPAWGAKRCGIVSLTLTAGTLAGQELIEPDGLAQHVITVDLPDPYRRYDLSSERIGFPPPGQGDNLS